MSGAADQARAFLEQRAATEQARKDLVARVFEINATIAALLAERTQATRDMEQLDAALGLKWRAHSFITGKPPHAGLDPKGALATLRRIATERESFRANDIAAACGCSKQRAHQAIVIAYSRGEIVRAGRGLYAARLIQKEAAE